MAYTLGNKCAKNLCKRTVLLQLIIKNVVTCFFEHSVVFPCHTAWQYSDGNPLTGASNAGGVAEIALLRLFLLNCLLLTLQQARCCQHDRQWC